MMTADLSSQKRSCRKALCDIPEMKIKIPLKYISTLGQCWPHPEPCLATVFPGSEVTCDPLAPTATKGLLGPYVALKIFELATYI